jgi:putative ABC transport system ATP-binding protein
MSTPTPRAESLLIEAVDVYKCFKVGAVRFPALNGVSLRIETGDFAVLAGRSGSGKTTLLHVLGGLEVPSRGTVRVMGQDLSLASKSERARFRLQHVGFVFQAYNLVPVLTARENVALVCEMQGHGRESCMARARAWLAEVGVGDLADRRPDQLSGGQQQRVAVARALASNPAIVLADEPTANLDSATGAELLALLRHINQEFGTTFLISSHDEQVIRTAGRVVRLEDGRVLAPGVATPSGSVPEFHCPEIEREERHRLLRWLRQGKSK